MSKEYEIDWDKVQNVNQLKTVVRLIILGFGGTDKISVNENYFKNATEGSKQRVMAICKDQIEETE
jgi:hypothetical protein